MASENGIRIRVAVVLEQEGKILLVLHKNYGETYWLLPGGGMEWGETIEECGMRELREETGLEVEIGDLLFVSEQIPAVCYPHVIVLYVRGRVVSGQLKVGEGESISDAQWFEFPQFPQQRIFPDISREVLQALQGSIFRRSLGPHPAGPTELVQSGLRGKTGFPMARLL